MSDTVWTPQPGPQTYFFKCPIEDVAFGGARGGGKSDASLGIAMHHILKHGEHANVMIVRHSLPQLEDIIARSHEIYPRIGASWGEQKKTWTFPNGAPLKFRFLSNAKDAANYQGHQYTLIIFEELTNWSDSRPIDMLRAALRSAHGIPCLMRATCNPGGPGHEWVFRRYIEPQNAVDVREIVKGECRMRIFRDPISNVQRCFIPSRLKDNPALTSNDPTYIQRLMDVGDPALVKAWLDGDWSYRPTGGIVKMEWFKYYDSIQSNFTKIVLSLDTANKNEAASAYTAITVWGDAGTNDYLLDVIRERLEFPELVRRTHALCERWNPSHVLIEDKASGTQLLQTLRTDPSFHWPLIIIEPEGDKQTRMSAVSGHFESGRVLVPRAATWLVDYVNEVAGFPETKYADQVDSTSQYLYWAHGRCNRTLGEIAKDIRGSGNRAEHDGVTADKVFSSSGFGFDKSEMDRW